MLTQTLAILDVAKSTETLNVINNLGRKPQHHRNFPILPIGKVNLLTGKNAMFGEVWSCWDEGAKDTNILVKEGDSYRIAHTSGPASGWIEPNDTISFVHDQTRQRIGGEWMVIATHPHTKQGLKELAEISGKKSLSMSTFK